MKDSYPGVRQDTIDTINNYVTKGWEPGSFVMAVLENNLMEAFGRADLGNRASLFEICDYIYNYIPSGAHGSPERVQAWMKYIRNKKESVNA